MLKLCYWEHYKCVFFDSNTRNCRPGYGQTQQSVMLTSISVGQRLFQAFSTDSRRVFSGAACSNVLRGTRVRFKWLSEHIYCLFWRNTELGWFTPLSARHVTIHAKLLWSVGTRFIFRVRRFLPFKILWFKLNTSRRIQFSVFTNIFNVIRLNVFA